MKLSANAQEHVKRQVREAFGKEYKKADDAVEELTGAAKDRFKKFKDDLEKTLESALSDVRKLISKHGLTVIDRDRYGEMHLELMMTGSHYSCVDRDSFAETTERESVNTKLKKLYEDRSRVEDLIQRAISKALFEIEVHGKKSDLETIVAEVIAEMKKGK